jgi:hypothetical protein
MAGRVFRDVCWAITGIILTLLATFADHGDLHRLKVTEDFQ